MPTYTATPTTPHTDTPMPTGTDTDTPPPTDTDTPTPAYTPTSSATSAVTYTPTNTPTDTETGAATFTATPTESLTETPTSVGTPSETATETGTTTVTSTSTITPTLTETETPTVTPSPTIAITLELSASPSESYAAPGGIVAYTVSITNTASITTTADLTATDSDSTSFTSSLQTDQFVLGPGEFAVTTLTVSVSSEAEGQIGDITTLQAMIDGVEYAKSNVTTPLLNVQFNRALTGLGTSNHFVPPETQVQIQVGISATAPLTSTVLTDFVPAGWTVTDTGGGALTAVNADLQKIEWNMRTIAAGAVLTRTYALSSPPGMTPPPEYSFQTTLSGSGQRFFSAPWSVVLKHPLVESHYRIGWDAPLDHMIYAAKTDAAALSIPRFKAFRVRFQVFNDQLEPVRWQPRLEWSNQSDGAFQVIVPGEPKPGDPFYIRPVDDVENGARIPTMNFGTGWDTHAPQEGYVFTDGNPAPILTLNPFSFTEIEFSVRATADAGYQQYYIFRLSDDGRLLTGPLAQIEMETAPVLKLTQPQYHGIAPNATPPSKKRVKAQANGNLSSPHGPYTLTGTDCESCHRSHTGEAGGLLSAPPAQSISVLPATTAPKRTETSRASIPTRTCRRMTIAPDPFTLILRRRLPRTPPARTTSFTTFSTGRASVATVIIRTAGVIRSRPKPRTVIPFPAP